MLYDTDVSYFSLNPNDPYFVLLRQLLEELFNDWGGRGYNDSVSVEVAKTVPSGDRTT